MSGRYEALIVDFGGVLTTPLQESFAAFAASSGIEFSDLVRMMLQVYTGGEDDLVTDYETGKVAEEEFEKQFAQRLSTATGRDIEAEGIVGRLFAGMRLEDEMLDLIRRVRGAGFKTGLLSNSWGTTKYPREIIDELFDSKVISGEVGMRKPDPAIFELSAGQLGVDPSKCIFVDDHGGHLKSAAELGMHTVLHTSPAETIAQVEKALGLEPASGS